MVSMGRVCKERETINMKVLLVNPSQARIYGDLKPPIQMHMGLSYIASVLKQRGIYVELIDMDADSVNEQDVAERIKKEGFAVCGITVTTPTLKSSLFLAKSIKEVSPHVSIVFGGIHPSVMAEETISFDEVDFIVRGEGEITFVELLEEIEGSRNYNNVKGILFKNNGSITETEDRMLIEDLDTLPFPARDLFANKSYTYPDSLYAQTAPLITSRGCPGRCTYCNAHSIFGRRFRARSAKNIVDEIEYLTNSMGIKEIHIWDDNFVTAKNRVYEIRDEIKKRNINIKFAFPNGIRADFLDKEMLTCLKSMGTYSIAVGVESGNQRVLDKAKKGIKLETIKRVFKVAKDLDIETWAFFMFGLPGETRETARETIEFAKVLDPDIAKFHILKPYPGTEAYDILKDKGFLEETDYDKYGIHTPPIHCLEDLTSDELLLIQKKAYREFYFRPLKILKQILRLRSLNRFKLNIKAAGGIARMALDKPKGARK